MGKLSSKARLLPAVWSDVQREIDNLAESSPASRRTPKCTFKTASLLIRQPSPTQVPCRPACTVLDQPHPHHRVYPPGRVARRGQAFPSGQSSPYTPATVPPPRAPPKAWAALARGTDSSPSNVPLRTDSPNPVAGSEVDGDAT